jgi:hypothetical protein
MWVRRTPTGFRLARPLEIAGWVVATSCAGVSGLVIYAAFVLSPLELLWLPMTVILTLATARMAMQHVDVLDGGIRTQNVLRTVFVPWSEFEDFEIGAWRAWRYMALVERRSRPPVPIGVLAISPMYEDSKIDDAVNTLRGLVEARRRKAG